MKNLIFKKYSLKNIEKEIEDIITHLKVMDLMDSRENNLDIDYNPELDKKEPSTKFQTEQ